jgi:hypothetical protein
MKKQEIKPRTTLRILKGDRFEKERRKTRKAFKTNID